MKVTNKFNLPTPLYELVKAHKYDKGGADFSATELLKPPRQAALQIKHQDDIEIDATDRIWALIGEIGHGLLAASAEVEGGIKIVEKKLVSKIGSYTLKGQIDLGEDDIIYDWKLTSVYTVKNGLKSEWEQQLNIYDALCWKNDITIKGAMIVAFLRDWLVSKSKYEKGYPPCQVVAFKVPLWPHDEQIKFIEDRIALHVSAREGHLPQCTADETWGGKRCERYCDVAKFCSQYQAFLDSKDPSRRQKALL